MRITGWSLLCVVAASACSGGNGDDDDDDFGLQTGAYTLSGAALDGPDECDLPDLYLYSPAELDGTVLEIVDVSADDVTFLGSGVMPRDGNVIGGVPESLFTRDWNTPGTPPQGFPVANGYNCVEEDFLTITMTIVDETTLDYAEDWTATAVSGSASECLAAISSGYQASLLAWPCESRLTADMIRD